jgi:hypothetical protein
MLHARSKKEWGKNKKEKETYNSMQSLLSESAMQQHVLLVSAWGTQLFT